MVNYVLSFCKITGASRIFARHFYLPLLKPLTPKDALRTLRITGKWLLGAKIQHYIPVLLNHRKKRAKNAKNYGKRVHKESEEFTYMTPVLDADNESHQVLMGILDGKKCRKKSFVYSVDDKKYNIVVQAQLEEAILDGDVIDVLVSQRNDKIIIKLKSLKKIPVEIQYYDGDDKLYLGEGATTPEDEKFHHHGKYTMSLAKMFEEKELDEERWEEELRRIMKKRKRQPKEGSKEWKAMVQESIKNLDWQQFEEDAKKIVEEIDEPAVEADIDMELTNLEATKNVNDTFLDGRMDQLPTLAEIPDVIRSMKDAALHEMNNISGVKVTLPSGKECFVSGQMVRTEDGDVFVPGQTIQNEHGLEYSPGITINVDNKPTLITGLILGEEQREPMFLPATSTITADGQLTFATTPEERPQPKKKNVDVVAEEVVDTISDEISQDSEVLSTSCELNSSDIEEYDAANLQHLELEKLKAFLLDDGLDDVISSIEDKRRQLLLKLEELRRLSVSTENSLVSYVSESDAIAVAARISPEKDTINRLADILMTVTRRAATFRDRNSINAENIQRAYISRNLSDSDVRFNNAPKKLKVMLKTAVVAANDVFKTRPKDQLLALNAIAEIVVEVLQNETTLSDLLELMKTPQERSEVTAAVFKQLTQNVTEAKMSFVNDIAAGHNVTDSVEKVLKKSSETISDAFLKVARVNPKIIKLLVDSIKNEVTRVKTEEDAVEVLEEAIVEATRHLVRDAPLDSPGLLEESVSFARALGMKTACEILSEAENVDSISDGRAIQVLQRTYLIRLLSERDYSLKSAIERVRKNPERGRSDPRIRQLIRESGSLVCGGPPLKNSRDVPLQMLKNQNLLAIEDLVTQRSRVELPVLVSRDDLQAVVPKEAARGVLAGRVAYTLVNESGVRCIAPRRFSMEDFGVREASSERDDDRTFLQAKSNTESHFSNYSISALHVDMVLFRPVYLRTQPLRYEPPPAKPPPPPPKEPTPPPPPPKDPTPEPVVIVREKPKEIIPILVCGYGVSAVYPKEATTDVLTGQVDYFLVDERGVTLFHKKRVYTAVKEEEKRDRYERVLDRFPKEDLGHRTKFLPVIGGETYGSDFSWSSPSRIGGMSSGSLRRGYTGPRA